jgi:fibronectin-binding autotransporter adhesin
MASMRASVINFWLTSASGSALTAMLSSQPRRRAGASLATTLVLGLAAPLSILAPEHALAADECGVEAPGADAITCAAGNYGTGINYTNSDGLTLNLNDPAITVAAGSGPAVGVVSSAANTNDIVINANVDTIASPGLSSSRAITAQNDGTAGDAIITMGAGAVTIGPGGAGGEGLFSAIGASGSGAARVTLNGGTVAVTVNNVRALRATNAGTGSAEVVVTGGAVTAGATFTSLTSSTITNAASLATSSVTISGGTLTATGPIVNGVFAGNAGLGDASVTMNGGAVATASAYGLRANITNAASAAATRATLTNGSITTTGAASSALSSLNAGSGTAIVEISGGSISASGNNADGVAAQSTGGTYQVDVTGGVVTGGGGNGAGIHTIAVAGGTVDIGADAAIDGGASGVALRDGDANRDGVDEIGGDAIIYTAGTLTGDVILGLGSDALNVVGGQINGDIVGDGVNNDDINFTLGSGAFTHAAAYAITDIDTVSINSGTVQLDSVVDAFTVDVHGGLLTLTAANTYAGGTYLDAGVVSVFSDANLGAAAGALNFNGGVLQNTASFASARSVALDTEGGAFQTDAALTLSGGISGIGGLTKTGADSLILTGGNTYSGGTTISGGTLQLGDGGATGSIAGSVLNNGALAFNRSDAVNFAGLISGSGAVRQAGAGTTVLTGANSYAGATNVTAGVLRINGDQSAAAGLTSVAGGATLGGAGVIGGDVAVADAGVLAPGNSPGVLTINGDLSLADASVLDFELGAAGVAGGPLNDLITVGGDLALDGVLNVAVSAGGAFDPGVYRIISYGGALTDNVLQVGIIPSPEFFVQTAVAGQVNLVNTAGLEVNYWDAGPKNDGSIAGSAGLWQAAGVDNWAIPSGDVNLPYENDAFAIFAGTPGTVTVDNGLGDVTASGLQFAVDGYVIDGGPLILSGPVSTIRVGDGTAAGAGYEATIASELRGASGLTKTDLGTLILTGANSYAGGTTISGGALQLGDGGTGGSIVGDVANDGALIFNRSNALDFAGTITGDGTIRQVGSGLTNFTADNSGFAGTTSVEAGILAVNGSLCGDVNVLAGGRVQGTGTICDTDNAGVVAPGNSIGTLTVDGDYVGDGGVLEIETVLGGDASASDRLVVTGATSGQTNVQVINLGGTGAQTVEGIKIVDIGGASNGAFSLLGDYVLNGEAVVVAGAYGYGLHKNGVGTPADGDWYLRSALIDPPAGTPDDAPLYQAGVPIYEAYAQALQGFNALGSLQQRAGNRTWGEGAADGEGAWLRFDTLHANYEPEGSTTGAHQDLETWKLQLGADARLHAGSGGEVIGSLFAQYGVLGSEIDSVYGDGKISGDGFGVGGALTWYASNGIYVDGQAQATWYESELNSRVAGALADELGGTGYGLSIEGGKQLPLSENLSLTPQAQLSYAQVSFDDFADPFGADVSLARSEALQGRLGLSLDHRREWTGQDGLPAQSHIYGIANLYYAVDAENEVDVAGTRIFNDPDQLWGGVGIGGSYNVSGGKHALFAEGAVNTSLENFGDSHSVTGTIGWRTAW